MLRAGVDCSRCSCWLVLGSRASQRGGRRAGATLVSWVGDTELSGVLELSVGILDDLQTVVSLVVFKVRLWCPGEAARVGNVLCDGVKWLDVLSWSTEEENGDRAGL